MNSDDKFGEPGLVPTATLGGALLVLALAVVAGVHAVGWSASEVCLGLAATLCILLLEGE